MGLVFRSRSTLAELAYLLVELDFLLAQFATIFTDFVFLQGYFLS